MVAFILFSAGCVRSGTIENGQTHLQLGIDFYNEKNYEMAEKHFKKGLEADPDNTQLLILLAGTYRFQKKVQEAQNILKQLLEREDSNVNAMLELAWLYFQTEEYDVSLSLLQDIANLEPRGKNYANLAWAYSSLGKIDEAEQFLQLAEEYNQTEEDPSVKEITSQLIKNIRNKINK